MSSGITRANLGPAARLFYDQQKRSTSGMPHEISIRTKKGQRDSKAAALEFLNICEKAELPRPELEYRFHPKRMWRFDFAWPQLGCKLALEVDGGVFIPQGGRHNRGGGVRQDNEKLNCAAIMGWRILKVFPEKLLSADTADMVRRALRGRAP